MTKEQFEKAEQILDQLNDVDRELGVWQNAKKLVSITVLHEDERGYDGHKNPDTENIDFATVKSIAINTLRARKVTLETEFESL